MERIIIYKEGQNLREKFENTVLTYTVPYSISFATDVSSLGRLLQSYGREGLLYFIVDKLSEASRLLLKKIQLNYPTLAICLCAHERHALDAWHMRVFDFQPLPLTLRSVKKALSYYQHQKGNTQRVLVLNESEGIVRLPLSKLNYLKASGNYTEVHTTERTFLPTMQLNRFEYLCELDLEIRRVHRSFIINFRNIQKVDHGRIVFYKNEQLDIPSQRLLTKIKRIMLGKE